MNALMGLSLFILFVLVVFVVESFTRAMMPAGAEVRNEQTRSNRKLVVLYAGLMNNVDTQFGAVADWYRFNRYDLLYVKANGIYDHQRVAEAAAEAVKEALNNKYYQSIVFDGLSLGGRAAVDTLQRLKRWGVRMPHTILLLEGAPMTYRSVLGPNKYGSWLIARLPFGWLLDHVPLVSWMFVPPKEQNIEPGADRALIAQTVAAARQTPLSRWSSELASFAARDAYPSGSLYGLVDRVVFMWFLKDKDTVDQRQAVLEWQRAFGQQQLAMECVNSTHVGIAEAPQANIDAHIRVLGG